MFAVLFEVQPKPGQTDTYLGYARMLRPEVEKDRRLHRQHSLSQPDARRLAAGDVRLAR